MYDPLYRDLMTKRSALFLDGWLKFNEEKWGYKPERVVFQILEKNCPGLKVFLPEQERGVVMPPETLPPLQFTPARRNSLTGFIPSGLRYLNYLQMICSNADSREQLHFLRLIDGRIFNGVIVTWE